jgi:hypothetical protein
VHVESVIQGGDVTMSVTSSVTKNVIEGFLIPFKKSKHGCLVFSNKLLDDLTKNALKFVLFRKYGINFFPNAGRTGYKRRFPFLKKSLFTFTSR